MSHALITNNKGVMHSLEISPSPISGDDYPVYRLTDTDYLNRLSENRTYINRTVSILDRYPEYVIFKMVFNVPFGMLILLSNVFTLIAIYKCSKLKNVTNIFIASLSLSDLLNAVPIMVIRLLVWISDSDLAQGLYMAVFAALVLSNSLSLYSHAALAIDRLVAIIKPLSYKQLVTPRRAHIVTAVIWILNITSVSLLSIYFGRSMVDLQAQIRCILHLPLVLPEEIYYGIILPEVIIFLFISVACYVRIFVAIKYRTRYHVTGPHSRPRDTEMARSAAMTTAIILMVLIGCWTPFSLLTSLIDIKMFYTRMEYFVMYELSVYLLYSNSFLNPLILYCRNRDFRKAYRAIMCLRPEGEVTPGGSKNNSPTFEGYLMEEIPPKPAHPEPPQPEEETIQPEEDTTTAPLCNGAEPNVTT